MHSDDSITLSADGSWTHVHIRGELDLISAPALLDALMVSAVDGQTHFAIDLSEVGFIDSSGIGALVHAARRLTSMRCIFKLVGVPIDIQRVFAATGVDGFLVVESPPPSTDWVARDL